MGSPNKPHIIEGAIYMSYSGHIKARTTEMENIKREKDPFL